MLKYSNLSLSSYQGAIFGVVLVISGIFMLNTEWWACLSEWNVWLEGAHFYIACVPFSLLDLCGSLIICIYYRNDLSIRDIYRGTLESFIACCLMQFGGTTLSGFILGQTPSWLVSHTAFNSFILAWWLVFFSPYDRFYTILCHLHTVLIPLLSVGAACSSGHSLTTWGVDKVVNNTFHVNAERLSQSIWTALLCGLLSACGGSFLKDWLNMLDFPSFTVARPPVLFEVERRGSPPGSPVKNVGFSDGVVSGTDNIDALLAKKRQQQGLVAKSLLLATLYYVLCDPSKYVKMTLAPLYTMVDAYTPGILYPMVHVLDNWSRNDACLLIVLMQVAHYFYKVFSPTGDDLALPFMRILCGIANISSTVPVSRVM